jgi:hypothetical protein
MALQAQVSFRNARIADLNVQVASHRSRLEAEFACGSVRLEAEVASSNARLEAAVASRNATIADLTARLDTAEVFIKAGSV